MREIIEKEQKIPEEEKMVRALELKMQDIINLKKYIKKQKEECWRR